MTSVGNYAPPAALAILQTCGLLLALIADQPWEWLAWVLVAAPCLMFAVHLLRGIWRQPA